MRLVFSAARCQLRDENGALRGGELLWVVSESRDVPLCPRKETFLPCLSGPLVQTNALLQPGVTCFPGRSGHQLPSPEKPLLMNPAAGVMSLYLVVMLACARLPAIGVPSD